VLQPGDELKRGYHIERILGQGGMGAVYLARHASLGRRVAIKETVIAVDDPSDREAVMASFRREAEILASLEHPNLVDVKDYFEEGGSHFLVMSYIDGATLEEIASQAPQPLAVRQVLEWADPICDVLAYLHEHAPPILIRDLKPSNVMVDVKGRVKLIDFGIARIQEAGQQTVTFLKGAGTVGFAPVEQFGGSSTDTRSDIYALGATLYCLLTRSLPPWSMQIATGEAALLPPSRLNPSIPPALDAVLLKAMSLRREDRFQSVSEMRLALRHGVPGESGAEPPVASAEVGHRFCMQCGVTLLPGAASCHQCGATRGQPSGSSPRPPGPTALPVGGEAAGAAVAATSTPPSQPPWRVPAAPLGGPSGGFAAGPSGGFAAGPSGGFAAGPSGGFAAGPSGGFAAGPSGRFDGGLGPPAQGRFHVPDGMPLDPARARRNGRPLGAILALAVILIGALYAFRGPDPAPPTPTAAPTLTAPASTPSQPASPPHIGVELRAPSFLDRSRLHIPLGGGVIVVQVVPESPAERAGIHPWDVVMRVDGTPVYTPQDVQRLVGRHLAGQTVYLDLWSAGARRSVPVTPQ
jgi:serine/threonine-protein kinase